MSTILRAAREEGGPRAAWRRRLRALAAMVLVGTLGAAALGTWAWLRPAESAVAISTWLLQAGDARGAEWWLARYTRVQGRSLASLALAGQLLVGRKHPEAAARYLEEVLRLDPDHPARVSLGLAYELMGRDQDAEAEYREAVRRRPSDPMALNGLGYFLAQRAVRLEEAVSLLHRALEFVPADGSVLDSLGWALYQSGDIRAALALLQEAARQVPSSGEIRYHLGLALARAGARDRALVELGKAAMLEPDLPGARQAVVQLRAGRLPPVPVPWQGHGAWRAARLRAVPSDGPPRLRQMEGAQ
ncbi:MAG: tetratricopeptide repeat protein [Armatimonadetes bacterium]|nr:tetratricopeptide repeat protein [Armatimonadota bacterium]